MHIFHPTEGKNIDNNTGIGRPVFKNISTNCTPLNSTDHEYLLLNLKIKHI
eukprot:Pgem_evm1s719